MFRAFVALSLIANLNSQPTSQAIQPSQWQAASLLEVPSIPVKDQSFIAPIINAQGAVAIDVASGEVLFENDAHKRRSIASITKVMTAIVILEENELDDVVIVSKNAADMTGSQMYLREGEHITVRNLMRGLLINSANDAAIALAEYNAGSVSNFVEKMNKKVELLGLYNSHFSNPIGFDSPENYSTPHDVAVMGRYLYRKPFIKETVGRKTMTVYSEGGTAHNLVNTNKLIGNYLNITGIKTGRTESAGLCLMAIGSNSKGDEVLSVVLDSPDRFKETKILVDWTFRAYNW